MNRPKILLADDHVLITQALEHLLRAEFDVVGTVADGRALLKAADELSPDVVAPATRRSISPRRTFR